MQRLSFFFFQVPPSAYFSDKGFALKKKEKKHCWGSGNNAAYLVGQNC